MSCVCICVHVCACVCVMTLKRPDRLVLCQQMEACIIQSGGSFMLFLFLSHHGSQRQTKQDLATEEKRGLQVVLPHWPSGCLPSPCSDPHPYHTHTHTHPFSWSPAAFWLPYPRQTIYPEHLKFSRCRDAVMQERRRSERKRRGYINPSVLDLRGERKEEEWGMTPGSL